jgi:radical SAM superfamily enzyme with C-terminal helix-hairpin-helix motif
MPMSRESPRVALLLLFVGTAACSYYRRVVPPPPPVGIDLNRANGEDIAKLPGLTPADADRIIANRPYDTKDAPLRRGLVTREQFERFANRVYVGRVLGESARD